MSQSVFGSFKKTVLGFLFGVLILLLLAGLSMFGVTDAFISQTKDAAATVGKKKITLQEFDSVFQRRLSDINKENSDERITTKQAYQRGLHTSVLNSLITERLLQNDADDLGLDVNDRDALELVEGLEVFNNEITGKLDRNKMLEVLSRIDRNKSPRELEKDVHKEIRRDQILNSHRGGVVTPNAYVEQQYKFLSEQRIVKLLKLTKDIITPPADPSDEELQAFIKDSPTGYIAPEYRRFTLLRMELENVLPDVEVTETEIEKQYDYKIKAGLLGTAETRSYQQLIATDKEQADKITAALNAGKDIATVVSEFALDAPLVYDDVLPGASSDPKAGEAAFKMDEGKAETVASSFGGWFTVVLTKVNPKTIPELETERTELINEIQTNKAKQVLYEASKAIQDGISEDGMTLEEAGKANGISVASFDFVSRLGETEAGNKLEGLSNVAGVATDDKIMKDIFLADPGFDGDVFETSKGGIAAIRVDQIKESAPRAFADIREQALRDWHIKKADEALAKLSQNLVERASSGESLEDLAEELGSGAEITEVKMMRLAPATGLGNQLFFRLFDVRVGQTVQGHADNGLDRIIGQVLDIKPNEDEIMEAISLTLEPQVTESINSDLWLAYQKAVLAENPVQTMSGNIEQVLGVDQ